MLTAKQYEVIGRLALAFNEIDEMIDMYLPYILGNPEWSVSLLMSDRSLSFNRKADFFRRVLLAIVEERPILEVQLKAVVDLLDKGKRLAEKRNGYVHSIGFIDYRVNK